LSFDVGELDFSDSIVNTGCLVIVN
jgi:hypothetical protein